MSSQLLHRFELNLDARLEYLTLAVANAKSHPISTGGRHETAIAFLTELEEKLDVAQVQLEIYNTLSPHINDDKDVGDRIQTLSKQLFKMQDVRISFLAWYFSKGSNPPYFNSFIKSSPFHLTCLLSSCCAFMFLSIVMRACFDPFGIRSSMIVRNTTARP